MHLGLDLLPYLEPLLAAHHQNNQQPDNLCGPYWISLLLKAYGNLAVSPVEVAIAAATILPSQSHPSDWLPLDAVSQQGPNYGQIPTQSDLTICGTAIAGLIHATNALSSGQYCLIPLQTPDWQAGLSIVLDLCQSHPVWQAIPLLNPHTRYLWGTTPSPLTITHYLTSKPITPPPTDWSVGHFNLLIGAITQDSNTLYTLLDTYPQFGWQGLHLQPPDALGQSLHRPQQTTQGGLALFVKTKLRPEIENLVLEEGFNISVWNNGSPAGPAKAPTPEPLLGGESG